MACDWPGEQVIPSHVPAPSSQVEVTVWPPAALWPRGVAAPQSEDARRFRQQLGLPTDRPVIMSGHQATLWHPGILSKWLAVRAWAEAHHWASAWVAVDHDPEDFSMLRVPARDERGRLVAVHVPLAPREVGERVRAGAAPCTLPAFEVPGTPPPEGCTMLSSVERARGALRAARARARTAPEQVMHAAAALIGGASPHVVLASRLGATDLFAALVQRMADAPAQCRAAYNDALRAAPPESRLTPLGEDPRRGHELPLWVMDDATGVRRRVWSADLRGGHGAASARLLPRALMLSGVLRLGACEVFVHGLGGGATRCHGAGDRYAGYDRATEAWIAAWLGRPLAPSVVVSATMRLPLLDGPAVTAREVAEARWSAHASRHTPAMVGDESGARRKSLALAEIIRLPRGSRARREAYVRMHADLQGVRAQRAPALAQVAERARVLARRFSDQALALDRTWSLALFEPAALGTLDDAVRARLGEDTAR